MRRHRSIGALDANARPQGLLALAHSTNLGYCRMDGLARYLGFEPRARRRLRMRRYAQQLVLTSRQGTSDATAAWSEVRSALPITNRLRQRR
jgi:hypothetical protein